MRRTWPRAPWSPTRSRWARCPTRSRRCDIARTSARCSSIPGASGVSAQATPDVASLERELHAAATQMTGGLTDFGPGNYLTGLRVLLDSLLRETRFTEMGRQFGMGTVAGTLAARLHTQRG